MSNNLSSTYRSEAEVETVSYPLGEFAAWLRTSWFSKPGAWIVLAFFPTLIFVLWVAVGAPALISLWLYIQISVMWVLGCSVLSNVLDKQRGDPFRMLGMWIGLTLGNLPILLSAGWIAVRFLLEFPGSGITGGRG